MTIYKPSHSKFSNPMLKAVILIVSMINCSVAVCQVVENDSIRTDSLKARMIDKPGWIPLSLRLNPDFTYDTAHGATSNLTAPTFTPAAIHPGQIAAWHNGGLTGFTSSQSMPGMMGIERGGFTVGQNFGDFSFNVYGEAVRYGLYRDLRSSLGYGGSISYNINDRVSVTMFGNYYTSPGPMHPAMAGYVSIPTFGGFLDYRISDRWGVQVGAQSYRSMSTRQLETQPIVMPYFRLSKKNIIGVDVGGILYQIIHNAKSRHHRENPMLPPPIPPLPPLSR